MSPKLNNLKQWDVISQDSSDKLGGSPAPGGIPGVNCTAEFIWEKYGAGCSGRSHSHSSLSDASCWGPQLSFT